tara:strand:- start:12251 stop:13327 length:1077 start_codon:yes stop_codon:yes gene_type:complete
MRLFKVVHFYIAKYIFLMTCVSMLFIAALDIFFNFLAVQNNVGVGNFNLLNAFLYAILCSPAHLVQIFPITMLLGVVFGLGVLSYRSELIILQANGLSVFNLLTIVIIVGMFFTAINMTIEEFVAPKARQLAELNRAVARSGSFAATSKEGVWLKLNTDFIHINEILLDGTIRGVTRYFIVNNKIQKIIKADKLHYKKKTWYAENVTITKIGSAHYKKEYVDKSIWDNFLQPEFLEVVSVSPEYLGMRDLIKFIKFRKENHLNNKSLKLALYQKISQPFIVLIMILLGFPFVFGKQRSLNFGLKAFLAIILGLIYFLVSRTFIVMVQAYKWPLIIGVLGPGIIFGSFALYLLYRTIRI